MSLRLTVEAESVLLPLCDTSATGSTVQCQHEKDVIDPPSIIEFFKEHPSDIPLVGTVEVIRMQEAIALLIRPGRHVVALTQNHPGEHGEPAACNMASRGARCNSKEKCKECMNCCISGFVGDTSGRNSSSMITTTPPVRSD
jgi:hypothetical protein